MSFPKLSRALHLKKIPTDVAKFFYDFVAQTVNYREQTKITRKDFLQLLIDMKNNDIDKSSDKKGKLYTIFRVNFCLNC